MKLEIGYNTDFDIRKECLDIQNGANFTILYLSDLHLNRFSKALVSRIIQCIETLDPTIILLGGDYMDSQKGLFYFEKLLYTLSRRPHVFAIAGNHDYFLGISKIQNVCDRHKVRWIENQSIYVNINGFKVQIVGTKPQIPIEKADFNILCLHQPIDITPFQNQFDLVFAGHLHGCQCVFWETEKGLFPGQWLYKWNFLKKKQGDCLYLISKGLGDTLPIRYNCRKDVLWVEIKNDDLTATEIKI